jgi:hypothetical protein
MSPYGVPHEAGGDTPANDAKMERSVAALMAKGYNKVSAIQIAKVTLFHRKKISAR